ncbi:MAG TPA: IS481 family transposase, partial [Lacunisphaera sp.]
GGVSFAALCRRFGISRKTGYKWRVRFLQGGAEALLDRPRGRGRRCNQTSTNLEAVVVACRKQHPTWGPRKLHRRLENLGRKNLPAVSTFARILRREGCIAPSESLVRQPCQRFARAEPNELWQMDFKGHFGLQRGGRCHPFTVLDDCSRYLVGLHACADEQGATVRQHLERIFTRYGLPDSILCDNGAPWGGIAEHTALTVWLLRLGVQVIHGRPRHPQTQGKDERFHRTLQTDLLARHDWRDLVQAQRRFHVYRQLYNHQRPHEAIDLNVPAARYRPSARSLPPRLPVAEYASGTLVRPVKSKGEITFRNRFIYVGRAFIGLPVALHPLAADGHYRLCYAAFTLGLIDLSTPTARPKGHYHSLLPFDPMCNP